MLLTGPGNYIAHPVPYSKVIGGERVSGPRVLLLFYSGVGGLGFLSAHSLMVNFKDKSRNLNHRKKKTRFIRDHLFKNRCLFEIDTSLAIKAYVRHLDYEKEKYKTKLLGFTLQLATKTSSD